MPELTHQITLHCATSIIVMMISLDPLLLLVIDLLNVMLALKVCNEILGSSQYVSKRYSRLTGQFLDNGDVKSINFCVIYLYPPHF